MITKDLYKKLDELESEYIKVWEEVCDTESPTNCKESVDKVGEYFINLAKEKGFATEICEQDVAGNVVCITLNPDAVGECVTLSGHIDTVHPKGLFGKKPTRFEGDKIFGPGVTDCKGGVVASFMAMDALKQIGFKDRKVCLIIQTDEECGSKISNKETVKYMCEKAKGAIAFLNTEGKPEENYACLERKGIIRFFFDIKGRAGHSSKCYNAANAVAEAALKIVELEKMKDPDGLTCNCGVIKGGTVANTVAEECSFAADIRFKTEDELKKVREIVENMVANPVICGCRCKISDESFRPAMYKEERNYKLLEKVNKIYRENGICELIPHIGNGGSDAAYSTIAGIPTIDCMGVIGGNIHSADEFAYVSSLKISAKQQALVCAFI